MNPSFHPPPPHPLSGLDHSWPLVHEHCKRLLLNLLVKLAPHNDFVNVAHTLLSHHVISDLHAGLLEQKVITKEYNFTGKKSLPTAHLFCLYRAGLIIPDLNRFPNFVWWFFFFFFSPICFFLPDFTPIFQILSYLFPIFLLKSRGNVVRCNFFFPILLNNFYSITPGTETEGHELCFKW